MLYYEATKKKQQQQQQQPSEAHGSIRMLPWCSRHNNGIQSRFPDFEWWLYHLLYGNAQAPHASESLSVRWAEATHTLGVMKVCSYVKYTHASEEHSKEMVQRDGGFIFHVWCLCVYMHIFGHLCTCMWVPMPVCECAHGTISPFSWFCENIFFLHLPALGLQAYAPTPGFLYGLCVSNSDPHACISPLPTISSLPLHHTHTHQHNHLMLF